ncbi:hypothetical protein EDB83DRAFT_1575099 [Lactarius deliciosus]|nr:hypothetical protein EDB83DRAFT_1575099 [Lactarius deliciosus]
MILNFNMMFLNDTIALLWILSDDAATVAAMGFRFIHVASNSFYLVRCLTALCVPFQREFRRQQPVGNFQGLADRAIRPSLSQLVFQPRRRIRMGQHHTSDPPAHLAAARAPLVLLLCSVLRAEQSGLQNLDSIVWPTQPRLPRSPRAAPVATSVPRCCTCMSSDTVSGLAGCGPSRCSPGGAHSARSHVI